jgi:hypothetical protein
MLWSATGALKPMDQKIYIYRMYNSWMPVLAEKLQGLVVWLPRETIRAVEH